MIAVATIVWSVYTQCNKFFNIHLENIFLISLKIHCIDLSMI
jgi:hypothetical protein